MSDQTLDRTTVETLHESFDASVWAREFVNLVRTRPDIPTDEGTMIGWFANALMRGFDEHARQEAARSVNARTADGVLVDVHAVQEVKDNRVANYVEMKVRLEYPAYREAKFDLFQLMRVSQPTDA